MADRENDDKGNKGGSYGAEYPESTERSPGGYGEMAKGGAEGDHATDDSADKDDDHIPDRQGGSSSGEGVSRSGNPVAGGGGDTTPAPDPFHASPT